MQFIGHTKSNMLIADEGKVLREVNDVYKAEYIDENGNVVDEHISYN